MLSSWWWIACLSGFMPYPQSPPWTQPESPSCSWSTSGAIRLPEEVISNHGSAFISNFSCKLAALLGVKLTPSTSYHPQTNGQTECMNQEIEAYLQVFMSHRQDDWANWLPLAEFAYNNKVHTATCQTLFELDTGQHPCLGVEPMRTSTIEAVDAFAQ